MITKRRGVVTRLQRGDGGSLNTPTFVELPILRSETSYRTKHTYLNTYIDKYTQTRTYTHIYLYLYNVS